MIYNNLSSENHETVSPRLLDNSDPDDTPENSEECCEEGDPNNPNTLLPKDLATVRKIIQKYYMKDLMLI